MKFEPPQDNSCTYNTKNRLTFLVVFIEQKCKGKTGKSTKEESI